jgi:hypothetical protein
MALTLTQLLAELKQYLRTEYKGHLCINATYHVPKSYTIYFDVTIFGAHEYQF